MKEIKARYLIESSFLKNNNWLVDKKYEQVLNAHKSYWIDCHKYDFSKSHAIKLDKNIMTYYMSTSPDGKHKITYTIIELLQV